MLPSLHPPINKLIIIDLTNGGFMYCQTNPEELLEKRDCGWAQHNIAGMSHPRLQYAGGGLHELQFTLKFYWEWDPIDVQRSCQWLKSLEYPTHAGTVLKRTPAICTLIMGLHYRGIKVVFKNVDIRYKGRFEPITLLPLQAEAFCTCWEWVDSSVAPSQIRGFL